MSARLRFVALVLAAAARPLAAQDVNPDSVQVRTERLAEGVYVLFGSGGNVGLSVGADGAFVVDDQFAPLTPKILAAIGRVTDRPVRFVLNTHWHFDHTGGNENMGKAGALIVAHDNVRRRMSTRQFMEAIRREIPASPPVALPVVTFAEGVTFHVNGDEVVVVHVPTAHTDGDAVVHFRRANVVHMGDVYPGPSFPFVDVGSGGSLGGVIAAVDRVLPLINDSTKVIPGHAPVTNRAALRAYRDVLAAVRDRVRRQVAAGATLERVLASKPAAEFDAAWGQGWVKSDEIVRRAYAEATRGARPGARR
jgi:glyoxylase-like metal-dependent hydrolase (beta-lactamase superfamily II)